MTLATQPYRPLLTLAFILIGCMAHSQSSRVLLADSLFKKQSYSEALKYYEREWNRADEKVVDVARGIAYCHKEMNQIDEAEEWFFKVVNLNPGPEDLYNYALALKGNEKYVQAEFVMEEFQAMAKNDSRVYSFNMNKHSFKEIAKANDDTELKELKMNTSKSDFGAMYSPEGVVFLSSRDRGVPTTRIYKRTDEPFLDIFKASINDDGSLSAIKSFDNEVNSSFHEGNCTFSSDGKTMYFTRNAERKGKKGKLVHLKIFSAEKTEDNWGNIKEFQWNSNDYSVGHPTMSADGRKLYFVSDRKGGFGGTDIYVCNLQADSTWGRPGNLGTLVNTEGDELFPYMHPDDVLYFSSNGHFGLGGLDLFVSPVRDGRCVQAQNLGAPYNSPQDDLTIIFNENRHKGYLSSNREEGIDNIYYFEVEYDRPSAVKGLVVDNATGKPMSNAIAQLYDAEGKLIEEKQLESDGSFLFFLEKMQCNYFVRIINEEGWTIFESAPTPCTYESDPINLGKVSVADQFWRADGTIKNKESKEPIEGFQATLVNLETGITELQITKEDGTVSFSLQPEVDYSIVFEKEGYFAKSGTFSTKGMQPGIVNIERYVKLFFEPLEVNKVVEIDNIYYALNDFDINEQSARALDNVVSTMKRNPRIKVEMGSHTDSQGTTEYNNWLCNERAEAVKSYLVSKGITPGRLVSKGYGESKLINHCKDGVKCTEAEHQQNRRTEFKMIKE